VCVTCTHIYAHTYTHLYSDPGSRAPAERKQRLVCLDADFHCSDTKLTNPHTTRSAVMYDFAKGVEGTRQGAPLWIEATNFQKSAR